MSTGDVYHYDDIDWHAPTAPGVDPEVSRAALEKGVGRKFLSQGDEGSCAQVVKFPPGLGAEPHSHGHAEIFMVLEGSCSFGEEKMSQFDMKVVAANSPYSFSAGDDGVVFLVVRNG